MDIFAQVRQRFTSERQCHITINRLDNNLTVTATSPLGSVTYNGQFLYDAPDDTIEYLESIVRESCSYLSYFDTQMFNHEYGETLSQNGNITINNVEHTYQYNITFQDISMQQAGFNIIAKDNELTI